MPRFKKHKGKVMPGLSTSTKELEERVRAKQVRPSTTGNVHSTEEEVSALFGKSRVENARDYVDTATKTAATKEKLAKDALAKETHAQQKAKEARVKADQERQAEIDRLIESNKAKKDAK